MKKIISVVLAVALMLTLSGMCVSAYTEGVDDSTISAGDIFDAEGEFKMGDVNADGDVDTTDLALLKKYLANRENPDADKVIYGNVDSEGKIDTTDLAILKKILANIY